MLPPWPSSMYTLLPRAVVLISTFEKSRRRRLPAWRRAAARTPGRRATARSRRRLIQSESCINPPAALLCSCPSTGLHGCRVGRGSADGRRAALDMPVQEPTRRQTPAKRKPEVMTSPIAGGVDCDLHPAVPHLTSLLPYLNDYWRDQVTTRGMTDLVSQSYPTNSPISSRPDWRPAQGKPGSSLADMKSAGARPLRRQPTASAIRSTACRWCFPRTWRMRSAAR